MYDNAWVPVHFQPAIPMNHPLFQFVSRPGSSLEECPELALIAFQTAFPELFVPGGTGAALMTGSRQAENHWTSNSEQSFRTRIVQVETMNRGGLHIHGHVISMFS